MNAQHHDFRRMDCEAIAHELDQIDWNDFFKGCVDSDSMFETFNLLYRRLINAHTPTMNLMSPLERHLNSLQTRAHESDVADIHLGRKLRRPSKRLIVITETKLNFRDSVFL